MSSSFVSLWLDEAREREPDLGVTQQSPPAYADVVIVGGGYTGLWTAIRVKEQDPSAQVVVLEATYCGYGASGRNGGIAEGSWAKLPTMVRLWGRDDAVRVAQETDRSLERLVAFCAEHGIDAQIRQEGNLWFASNRSQLDSWAGSVGAAAAAGLAPYAPVDGDEMRRRTGAHAAHAGVFETHAATLQPALLARGLRRVAIELGVQVCEGVRMRDYAGRAPVRVTTTRGVVTAERLVLATGAWTATHRAVRGNLFVTSSDLIATRPLDLSAAPALAAGVALGDSRRLVLYWRSTPSGRVVFGKGGGWMSRLNRVDRRFTGRTAREADVQGRFARLYPQYADEPIDSSWNGPVDYSSTGLPYLGPLVDGDPAVLVGVGFSGMGVVQCELAGRVLAAQLLDHDDDLARLPLTRRWHNRLPPEPFRSIGAPLVKLAMERKERLEDAEARPDRLTVGVSRLDPTAGPSQSE